MSSNQLHQSLTIITPFTHLQLSMASEKNQQLLQKVWVSVYDSGLSDEQVCRLAAKHNMDNQESRQTKWVERVVACRQWLYQINKKDYEKDDTPASSTAWKKSCQTMYIPSDKVRENIKVRFRSCHWTEINRRRLSLVAGCELVGANITGSVIAERNFQPFFLKSQNNLTREHLKGWSQRSHQGRKRILR